MSQEERIESTQDRYNKLEAAYASDSVIIRSTAEIGRTYENFNSPSSSIKSEYTRRDYDYFRENERVSNRDDDILKMGMKTYNKVGIIKSIIDLMGDFTCKGIRLVHSDSVIERFYQEWFEYVGGQHVSERFANYLYRIANVPVYINYGTVPLKTERKWKSAYGVETQGVNIEQKKPERRRIPLKYSFLNPLALQPLFPELYMFGGKSLFELRITSLVSRSVQNLRKEHPEIPLETLNKLIPEEIQRLIKSGKTLYTIPEENLALYYYKKDDWDIWAKPMTHAIMDDIIELEKMKLADISALDGAISSIRLWNIGYLSENPLACIIPTPTIMNHLKNQLAQNVGGGVMDLVWGPELSFTETNTQVHNYLGMEKYEPVFHNIYEGMGMPIADKNSAGTNLVKMQTFVERMEYGRSVLTNFWNTEIKKVQLAMGYRSPAKVQYDKIIVGDEVGMMKLMLEIWDRGIIPDETIQESLDYFPPIVQKKLKKEFNKRKNKTMPPKAGPYFNYENENEFKKILLQNGGVVPSELGIELEEKNPDEVSILDKTHENNLEINKQKIAAKPYAPPKTNGRPKNSRDGAKRKTRKPKLSARSDESFFNTFLWANAAQKQISDILTPGWVKEVCGKKDVRALTTEEFAELEQIKFYALCSAAPFSTVDLSTIKVVTTPPNSEFVKLAQSLVYSFIVKNGREPTMDEKRHIQSSAYTLYFDKIQKQEELAQDKDELDNNVLEILGAKQ